MEQLTIKELAPYLPYKLRFTDGENTAEMLGLDIANATCEWTGGVVTIPLTSTVSKPILRPLSQLAELIEHNGRRFIPMNFWDDKARIDLLAACSTNVESIEYLEHFIVEQLLYWHFDIFGLIEKGLAIEIKH